jgi:hypothetical protein
MSDDRQDIDHYLDQLEVEMQRRRMNASDIAEASANVRELATEESRPPQDIFGSPADHAGRLASIGAPPTPAVRSILRVVLVAAAAWFGAGALIGVVRGEDSLGMPAVIPLVICLTVVAAVVIDTRRSARPPR